MSFTRITFLNAGHCGQLGWLAGRAKPGPTRFHAVFVLLEHERHGIHLIDTGYSNHFVDATRHLPQKLYRWTTPVHLDGNAASILAARGIDSGAVRSIFISHFHGDHIAGLRHFPDARFVHRREAYESLMGKRPLQQVTSGFLASLLPDDFSQRGIAIEERALRDASASADEGVRAPADEGVGAPLYVRMRCGAPVPSPAGTAAPSPPSCGEAASDVTSAVEALPFPTLDYFGDNSLLLVDLPGHSPGHLGFAMRTESQRFLYIADAAWDLEAMLAARRLPAVSRWFQHDAKIYEHTQQKLRDFAAMHPDWTLLACHCPRTQAHVDCH